MGVLPKKYFSFKRETIKKPSSVKWRLLESSTTVPIAVCDNISNYEVLSLFKTKDNFDKQQIEL